MPSSRSPHVGLRLRLRLSKASLASLASLCVAALTVASASVVLFAAPPPASAATQPQALAAAYAYGRDRGYHVGIAVLDTQTGKTYAAGDHSGTYASESVVKVMIATRVYLQGRLHGATASRVYTMITRSDDQIANDLYGSVGGDGLITWVKNTFHLPNLGSQPRRAGWWGNTHITPDGMVALYGKIKSMPYWGSWLINAMAHATPYGSDGFYQWFGLKSAQPQAAIKQGWGTDYDDWSAGADENTTGFVDGNRYAVAILARGPARTYGAPLGAMLTATAKLLLPGGAFPSDAPSLTTLNVTRGQTGGGQSVLIHGHNLTGANHVYFGSVAVRTDRVDRDAVLVRTPRHDAGMVRLRVVTDHGTSTAAGPGFNFILPPRITGLSPAHGLAGTQVTVTGTDFVGPTHVLIGQVLVAASNPNHSTLTFTVPTGVTGTVTVRPNTAFGTAGPGPMFTVDPPAPVQQRATTPSTGSTPSAAPTGSTPSVAASGSTTPTPGAPPTDPAPTSGAGGTGGTAG